MSFDPQHPENRSLSVAGFDAEATVQKVVLRLQLAPAVRMRPQRLYRLLTVYISLHVRMPIVCILVIHVKWNKHASVSYK